MTATVDTRKRSRDEDGCDAMPLSKRINNLHINTNFQNNSEEQQASSSGTQMDGGVAHAGQQEHQQFTQRNDYDMDHQMHQPHDPRHHTLHLPNQDQQQQHQHWFQHQQQHLQNTTTLDQQHQHAHAHSHTAFAAPQNHHIHHHGHHQGHHQHHHHPEMPMMEPYAPDLNPDENPFYYNKNKLLYDLHMARMQRNH